MFPPVVSLGVRLGAEIDLGGQVLPVGHDEVSALWDNRPHADTGQHPRDVVPLVGQVNRYRPEVALLRVEPRHFELEGSSHSLLDWGGTSVHTVLMDNLKRGTDV